MASLPEPVEEALKRPHGGEDDCGHENQLDNHTNHLTMSMTRFTPDTRTHSRNTFVPVGPSLTSVLRFTFAPSGGRGTRTS